MFHIYKQLSIMCKRALLCFFNGGLKKEEEEYETKGGRRRTWDDDFVLKRQFSALVPAFDPRPGRTNVQQTTDLEIPQPGTVDAVERDTFLSCCWLQCYCSMIFKVL